MIKLMRLLLSKPLRWTLRSLAWGALALGLGVLSPAVPAQPIDSDVIGGKDIVPINPDFDPGVDPVIFQDFPADFFNVDPPQTNATVSSTLGAALSQAISAGNRPSVLTPYAGIIYGTPGEDAVYDSFGSLVTNKASTLGKGKLGIGLSYQHAKFNEFDGEDIGRQVDTKTLDEQEIHAIDPTNTLRIDTIQPFRTKMRIRARDVEFKVDVITLSLTYGVLENLDIGALIPYIFLNTSGRVTIDVDQSVIYEVTAIGFPLSETISTRSHRRYRGKFDRDFDGFGDVILFSKYQFMSQDGLPKRIKGPLDMALQLEIKLPTGNEDEFLGTGKTDVALRLLMQRALTENFRARGEAGFNISGLGSEFSTFDWKAGGEYKINPRLAASAELIGSYSRQFETLVDVAVGAKLSVTRDFKMFAGVRAPLNDNGLRYAYSPIVGLGYVFSPRPKGGMDTIQPLDMIDPAILGGAPGPALIDTPPATSPAPIDTPPAQTAPAVPPARSGSAAPAQGGLSLEPVQSETIVGPRPAAPAREGVGPAGSGTDRERPALPQGRAQ